MFKRLWNTSPELIATAALMAVVLAAAIIGLMVDPRVITGAPAWLKPAKFAVSIAAYTVTLAWLFTFIPERPRTRHVVGWATAATLVLEMGIIGSQAWRGTASHFNVETPYDAILFEIMGAAIATQTLMSIAVAVALWRQRFDDRPLGWALRFGVALTIVGAASGGLMARPTAAQLDAARDGHMTVAGAHTVGGVDGGPGIAGTGWSTEHGDLRVPHFVGLHAMQMLPLVALVLARRRIAETRRVRLVLVASASYGALYVILLTQALMGVPFVSVDAATLMPLIAWATATIVAARMALSGERTAVPGTDRARPTYT